jgi:hypothetical protein
VFKFYAASDLRLGAIDVVRRLDGATVHRTTLQLIPPATYEVTHTAFVEIDGQELETARSVSQWDDLEEAHDEVKRVHYDPPTSIG